MLWLRLAAAAPIQLQAWELPYAAGAALKRQKKKKTKASAGSPRTLRAHILESEECLGPNSDSNTCYCMILDKLLNLSMHPLGAVSVLNPTYFNLLNPHNSF